MLGFNEISKNKDNVYFLKPENVCVMEAQEFDGNHYFNVRVLVLSIYGNCPCFVFCMCIHALYPN